MAGVVAARNAPGHLTAVMLSKDLGGGVKGPGRFCSSINHEMCVAGGGGGNKSFCSVCSGEIG